MFSKVQATDLPPLPLVGPSSILESGQGSERSWGLRELHRCVSTLANPVGLCSPILISQCTTPQVQSIPKWMLCHTHQLLTPPTRTFMGWVCPKLTAALSHPVDADPVCAWLPTPLYSWHKASTEGPAVNEWFCRSKQVSEQSHQRLQHGVYWSSKEWNGCLPAKGPSVAGNLRLPKPPRVS